MGQGQTHIFGFFTYLRKTISQAGTLEEVWQLISPNLQATTET